MTFWQSVYSSRPWRTTALLHRILMELRRLREIIEMQFTDILELLTAMDTATNDVAARIQALIDQIATTPAELVTQEQLDALGAALTAEKDRLIALAADPTDPIPS